MGNQSESKKISNEISGLGRCCRPMLCVKTMCKQYKLATPPMSKVVFVGNVPYNLSVTRSSVFSSRLVRSSVLSILSAPKMQHIPRTPPIRLVYDRDTGRQKGYGFCEFRRDLFLEGKTTVKGELVDGGVPGPTEPRTQWRTGSVNENRDILASVSAVLAHMKAFVITRPEKARQVLQAHPQLGYAIFMGLITSKIIPAEVLQRMLEASGVLPPRPAPPPHLQQHPPPPPRNFPPPQLQQNQPYPPPPNRLQHPQPVPGMMLPPPMTVPPPSAMFGHQVHMAPPPPVLFFILDPYFLLEDLHAVGIRGSSLICACVRFITNERSLCWYGVRYWMTKIQQDILDVRHLKAAVAAVVVTLASAVAWDEAAGGPADAAVGAVEGVGVVGAVEDDVGVTEGALAVDRACNIAAYTYILLVGGGGPTTKSWRHSEAPTQQNPQKSADLGAIFG
ncbi:hypothetical protein C8J57DRAFT_1472417 [Mycena rebaudengoi]|nr:hypothetical protein C8J57DRAFT_1472417 [Mycena rebaudengoi]